MDYIHVLLQEGPMTAILSTKPEAINGIEKSIKEVVDQTGEQPHVFHTVIVEEDFLAVMFLIGFDNQVQLQRHPNLAIQAFKDFVNAHPFKLSDREIKALGLTPRQ